MSTVVTLRLMVFNSASRYKSMKYSWQNKHAPFRRPSIVEAWEKFEDVKFIGEYQFDIYVTSTRL